MFWSSTPNANNTIANNNYNAYSPSNGWNNCNGTNSANCNDNNGNINNNNPMYVRCVKNPIYSFSMITCEDIFIAYFQCRQNKRNTTNALKFELNYESNVIRLYKDIVSSQYEINRSIAFVVDKPVKREIFAADFRDRIVHHLVVNRLLPIIEPSLIHDSYACRVGRGTFFGIDRVEGFMRSVSENYTQEAWILKLDISGFFMHIDHTILLHVLENILDTRYPRRDEILLLFSLCEKIVRNDPTKNCIIKGMRSNWENIPHEKSLFHASSGVGLPIGNLSSQVFANLYMHIFDQFVKEELKVHYYGRYVDDMIFMSPSREHLESLIPEISRFLSEKLHLSLHPQKIEFRRVSDGIDFIGGYIKPYRTYVRNRTKGNFHETLEEIQKHCHDVGDPDLAFLKTSRSRINSYLGYMGNFDTFRLRKTMLEKWLSRGMKQFFKTDRLYRKVRIVKSGCAPPPHLT